MIKKQTNQELITASLLDLLENNRPFKSITIRDIADNCGISRRTFYNFFTDKYDIVIQLYLHTIQHEMPKDIMDYYSFLLEACKDIEKYKQYWKKFFKDPTCYAYLESISYKQQYQWFNTEQADAYEKSLLRFYCLGFFRTISDWILNGCQTASEIIAATLSNTAPNNINLIYPKGLVRC